MTKKRVLFVDDQPNVLAALRRMLHSRSSVWDMEFASSGEEALARQQAAPFDVVVTDMRMPGMDGVCLLNEIRCLYPDTVRIILSGQAEQAAIERSVGLAHQFLSKPCSPELIEETISKACALRDRLASGALKSVVSRISTLPSLPDVYLQLVDELRKPDASVARVGELISQDVAMTAKLMHLLNSSFFGLPRRVQSPAHAASLLGLNMLRPLVFSAGIFAQFPATLARSFSVDRLVKHSVGVSTLAQRIAESAGLDKQAREDALLAGMLHDVGQLILAANMPDEFVAILSLAGERQLPLHQAEFASLGTTHADVGAYLLGLWGLPPVIVEAVAFHHEPHRYPGEAFGPVAAVHLANVLQNQLQQGPAEYVCQTEIDLPWLTRWGLVDRLPQWRELAESLQPVGAPL